MKHLSCIVTHACRGVRGAMPLVYLDSHKSWLYSPLNTSLPYVVSVTLPDSSKTCSLPDISPHLLSTFGYIMQHGVMIET